MLKLNIANNIEHYFKYDFLVSSWQNRLIKFGRMIRIYILIIRKIDDYSNQKKLYSKYQI